MYEYFTRHSGSGQSTGKTRRRWLVICGAGATAGIAGCLDDDDDTTTTDGANGDDDDTTDDENGDDTDEESDAETDDNGENGDDSEGDHEAAQQSYDDAIDELVANAVRIEELTSDEEEATREEVDTFGNRLNNARNSLNEAESGADDELAELISVARGVVSVQQELTEYHSIAVDLDETIESAFAAWEQGDFEEAADRFSDGTSIVDDISDQIDAIQIALDGVDGEPLGESRLTYNEPVWTYINPDSDTEVEAIQSYFEGFRLYALMFDVVVAGEEQYEANEFAAAEDSFADALAIGMDAREVFDELRGLEELPEQFQASSVELFEEVQAWLNGIERFEEAAQIAQTGDIERANEVYEEGIAELP